MGHSLRSYQKLYEAQYEVFLLPKHCYPSLPLVPITLCFTGVRAGVEMYRKVEVYFEIYLEIWKFASSRFKFLSIRFRDEGPLRLEADSADMHTPQNARQC